ncbi:transmembrane 4 L6 family member 1-like [Pungitius pungitius]|uniref:transmembrane 4 L6 family member 1-like n=1 Tax=Pungitius pungitius TaxID=134920 RepID=UPI0018879869|nr:transmembrane 4 L6 family member 1-like [Pungitius pungitius]
MCSRSCSRWIGVSLYPLVLTSIICNIVLFFPGWDVKYAKEGHITQEVQYFGGIVGGGLMMLIPAIYFHLAAENGCCGIRSGMFLPILLAAAGAAGGVYSFVVALLGVYNGPFCGVFGGIWTRPFQKSYFIYLINHTLWAICSEPENVVQFNTGLFCTLMATSCVQVLLCAIQMLNGLVGCLRGACNNKAFYHVNYNPNIFIAFLCFVL